MNNENTIINILYTGDYTNENLGHEIINTYKSDNGNDYIYISPYGSIHKDRDDKIKYVILARGIGKNTKTVEVIAIAEVDEQIAIGLTERPEIRFEYLEKDSSNWKIRKNEKDEFENWTKTYRKEDYPYCKEWKAKNIEILKNTKFKEWEKSFIENFNKQEVTIPNEIKEIKDFQKFIDKYKSLLNKNISHTKWVKIYNTWDTQCLMWESYRKPIHNQIQKYIVEEKIEYNKCLLYKIFEDNMWNESAIYITFKTKGIYKPKEDNKIYITIDKTQSNDNTIYIESDKKQICNQSCKFYANLDEKIFEKIKDFCTETLNKVENSEYRNQNSFLDFIKRQNDELAYSNMLAYFLDNKLVFKEFIDYLKKDVPLKEKTKSSLEDFKINNYFKVEREKYNIDLLIHTDKYVIVIENKIKSGLNGKKEIIENKNIELKTQLDKYYKIITGDTNVYNDKQTTNKEKEYYDNAYELGFHGKESSFLIFVPQYLYSQMEKDIKNTPSGKNYSIVSYKDLCKFFSRDDIKEHFKNTENYKYYEDFLSSLASQSSSTDNRIEQEMEYKFRLAIEKQQNKELNK